MLDEKQMEEWFYELEHWHNKYYDQTTRQWKQK